MAQLERRERRGWPSGHCSHPATPLGGWLLLGLCLPGSEGPPAWDLGPALSSSLKDGLSEKGHGLLTASVPFSASQEPPSGSRPRVVLLLSWGAVLGYFQLPQGDPHFTLQERSALLASSDSLSLPVKLVLGRGSVSTGAKFLA